MDFSWSPEQKLMRTNVRAFAEARLAPRAREWDEQEIFPWEQLKELATLGLTGLGLPESYGGQPADFVTIGLVLEELARADIVCADIIMNHVLMGAGIIAPFAGESVKQQWLPALAKGEVTVGLALTEPGTGTDAAALRLSARREGDCYILNGEKTSITAVDATVFIVFARTGGPGSKGISAFVVPAATPGLSSSWIKDMGLRGIRRGSLFFDDVPVPVGNLLSEEGQGFFQVMQGFDFSRAYIGLLCLGVAGKSLEETVSYVQEREAFGSKIGRFEAISFRLAEDLTLLEAARLTCYKALWLRDNNLPHCAEASMAKWWAPRVAREIIHNCLLAHGHYGYSREFPFEKRLRDVIGFEIGDGTAEASKIVIVREKLGREFKPY